MNIGVLTGGGDCPGLNAVIRAIVKKGHQLGYGFTGIKDGWLGLIENKTIELTVKVGLRDFASRRDNSRHFEDQPLQE